MNHQLSHAHLMQVRSRAYKKEMNSIMGNCQVLTSRSQPHKVNQRKRLTRGLHHTTNTMSMSSMMSLCTDPEHWDTAFTRDVPSVAEPRPSPHLSVDASLRFKIPADEELGGIRYSFTCLEVAIKESTISRKPILLVEVYVPGNVTAGSEVFSHPLIVEASETLFVPVQCRQGHKRVNFAGQISYTTLRIVEDTGVDLVKPLVDTDLSVASFASAMIDALTSCDLYVPTYLTLLEVEHSGSRLEGPPNCKQRVDRQAVFGLSCSTGSARGEVEFAEFPGVLSTRAGYYQGQHAVQVTYDTTRLSYCSLVRQAIQKDIADTIFYRSNEERIVGIIERTRLHAFNVKLVELQDHVMNNSVDPKHVSRTTMLRFVPLTDLQSTRTNRLVSLGKFNEAVHLLGPRQGQILMRAMHNNPSNMCEAVDIPITTAWKNLFKQLTSRPCQ